MTTKLYGAILDTTNQTMKGEYNMTDKKLRDYLKKEIKRLEKLIASHEDDKEVYHYFTGKKEAYKNLLEIV